ncbi:MAG: hypothetical protein KAG96_04495 [Ichthyobacteriaceae bacterium]|nr:hypothetical protein [Ichthyobacteriaceae bacterium]
MKKLLIAFIVMATFSCGGETEADKTKIQSGDEIEMKSDKQALDSISSQIKDQKKEIEESSKKLDELLDDI